RALERHAALLEPVCALAHQLRREPVRLERGRRARARRAVGGGRRRCTRGRRGRRREDARGGDRGEGGFDLRAVFGVVEHLQRLAGLFGRQRDGGGGRARRARRGRHGGEGGRAEEREQTDQEEFAHVGPVGGGDARTA